MTLLIRSCSGPDARLNREEHDEDERKDRTADPAHAMAGRSPRDQERRFSAASVVQAAAAGKQRGQRSMRGGVMMVVVAPSIFFAFFVVQSRAFQLRRRADDETHR